MKGKDKVCDCARVSCAIDSADGDALWECCRATQSTLPLIDALIPRCWLYSRLLFLGLPSTHFHTSAFMSVRIVRSSYVSCCSTLPELLEL